MAMLLVLAFAESKTVIKDGKIAVEAEKSPSAAAYDSIQSKDQEKKEKELKAKEKKLKQKEIEKEIAILKEKYSKTDDPDVKQKIKEKVEKLKAMSSEMGNGPEPTLEEQKLKELMVLIKKTDDPKKKAMLKEKFKELEKKIAEKEKADKQKEKEKGKKEADKKKK